MINVSDAFKTAIKRNRIMYAACRVEFCDGTEIELDSRKMDFYPDGLSVNEAVSSTGNFDVGGAIIGQATLKLYNGDERFLGYDFGGAVIHPRIGLQLSDGIEWVERGEFTAEPGEGTEEKITVKAYDNMHKFDKDYSEVKTAYPATIGVIVRDICQVCEVSLLTTVFDGSDIVIDARPDDEKLSCRQMLSYAAQRACKFVKCDAYGRVVIGWFAQGAFEASDNLDGGIFDMGTPSYTSGDNVDGGIFNPWNMGYEANAGTFSDQGKFHHLYDASTLSHSTDDVIITGVSVTEEDENQEESAYLYGEEGYVLTFAENPLIQKGKAREAAEYLGRKLVGLRFRPMSGAFVNDPTVEAGDLAYVTDRKQKTYHCLLTNVSYTIGNYMRVSCDAKTPVRNSAKRYSELARTYAKIRRQTQAQISEYDKTVQDMTKLISQGFGMYFVPVKQEDGSEKWYMCDKPTIEESSYALTITGNGLMASVDGGTTWAIDKNGNALFNVLSVIGFMFDWARGGILTLGGYNNTSGELKVLDSDGKIAGAWDKDGITLVQGTVGGWRITENSIYQDMVDDNDIRYRVEIRIPRGRDALKSPVIVCKSLDNDYWEQNQAYWETNAEETLVINADGSSKFGKSGISSEGDITASRLISEDVYSEYKSTVEITDANINFILNGLTEASMFFTEDQVIDGGSTYTEDYLAITSEVRSYGWNELSDERKKDIDGWDERYDGFLMDVEPIMFTWKDGKNCRIHTGVGAQTTKKLLEKHGLKNRGLVTGNEKSLFGVAYSEFNAIEIASIQKNRKLIKKLEQRNMKAEKELRNAKKEIKELKEKISIILDDTRRKGM